jgi:hypothetical protein
LISLNFLHRGVFLYWVLYRCGTKNKRGRGGVGAPMKQGWATLLMNPMELNHFANGLSVAFFKNANRMSDTVCIGPRDSLIEFWGVGVD